MCARGEERELEDNIESVKSKTELEGGVDRLAEAVYSHTYSVLNCEVLMHS